MSVLVDSSRRGLLLSCSAALVLATAVQSMARTIYVDKGSQAQVPDGTTWADAWQELRDALDPNQGNPRSGDEIRVAAGTYKPHTSLQSKSFVIDVSNLIIRGGYDAVSGDWDPLANETILSGDIDNDGLDQGNSYHVVRVSATGVRVEGLTISGGYADGGGDDQRGGGIICGDDADMEIVQCVISNNYADERGGGVFCSGEAIFANCKVTDNEADVWGGGVDFYYNGDTIHVSVMYNCIIADNWTIDRSSGNGAGAAIEACTDVEVHIINCTITGNDGAENATIDCDLEPATVTILNSVVWGNYNGTGTDYLSTQIRYDEEGWVETVTATYSDIEQHPALDPFPGTGNINDDPLLLDDRITEYSPCIDAGDSSFQPDAHARRDIDGMFRIWYGSSSWIVDMGANEYASNCYGDLDDDDDIDETDEAYQWAWYETGGTLPSHGDMDMDGDVELDDVAILVDLIGTSCQ